MRRAAIVSSISALRLVVPFGLVSCLVGSLAGCGGDPRPSPSVASGGASTVVPITPSPAAPPAPPPRADGRLPALATPVRYALTLNVDPAQPRFSGVATIVVEVAQPTRHLVLHGHDLNVTRVSADAGGATITGTAAARVAHGGLEPEELVLTFASALPAGQAKLEIAYDAPFGAELSGLYRVKEGDRWYAFTQFEATDARRAFPGFDEPSYKVPFDLAITTPRGMIAVANAPEAKHADDAKSGTRFEFATTPPLPTYLLAFAIGDFDVRPGPTAPVPIRLISAKGKAKLGASALEAADGLTKALGDYFGVKYPYAKLDIVAVPDFAAGAMENPGLITFREELLLQDPAHTSAHARKLQALVIGHELAHIWFGDLVTMQWWNDLWLNEGFATWMETKATDTWRPSMGSRLEAISDAHRVMDTDALHSTRAIREPVSSTGEATESFDGITYQKGAAVLGMIEHWVGEETFQRGVRDYIQEHSWKNAKAEDLLTSLDHASKRDVSAMAATFLDHTGVPSVTVTSTCGPKSRKIELRQMPWRPLGVEAKEGHSLWTIPVCIQDAGSTKRQCTELTGETGALEIASPTCPAWSYPNADEAGYYRFSLPVKDVRALAKSHDQLDVASRLGLLSNLWAQVRAGELSPSVLLETLPAFDNDTNRHVIERLVDILDDFDTTLVTDATRAKFRTYVAARMAGHKRALGWAPVKGVETDSDRSLSREAVLFALGRLAEDDATLKEADDRARAWLADPASVPADVADTAVRLASFKAGAERFEALRAAAKNARTPQDRVTALRAIGGFGEPAMIRRALDLIVSDETKMQDARYILGREEEVGALGSRSSAHPVIFEWLKTHWEPMRAKLAGSLARKLVDVAETACTKADRDDAEAFFTPRAKTIEGAARPLGVALEHSSACVELRARSAGDVASYFTKGTAAPAQKK